jgi:ATP-dependent helicase/nuclease subunit B
VTEVEDLVRDPYKVYARRVLGCARSIRCAAARRGAQGLHFTRSSKGSRWRFRRTLPEDAEGQLLSIADDVLAKLAPWPVVRRLWHARMAAWRPGSFGPKSSAGPSPTLAARGQGPVAGAGPAAGAAITLVGKADRIDRLPDGRIAIYDYKSGKPPTEKEERSFSKQLWLEAAMAADGAFGDKGPLETARIAYIGLGATPSVVAHDPDQATRSRP